MYSAEPSAQKAAGNEAASDLLGLNYQTVGV